MFWSLFGATHKEIDLYKRCPSVLKSMYHPRFTRDPNLPLFKVALSTSSVTIYFNPYFSESYIGLDGNSVDFKYTVDGGVWANNPSLIALVEAKLSKKILKTLNLLSIGTGQSIFGTKLIKGIWCFLLGSQ